MSRSDRARYSTLRSIVRKVTDVTKLRSLAAVVVAVSAAALSGCAGVVVGAGATAGTAAVEDRGISGAISDTKIRAQINDLWFRSDIEMFRKVDLTILEGRVMLTGVVATEKARAEAVRLAWQASGVKDVYDDVEVVPNGEATIDKATDTWIEEKLNTKLLFDKKIENVNYAVDVVDGVVYVMGIAQSQDELDRVIAYARDIANVKRVVSHVVLKTSPQRVTG